jgi:hypothetical protein
MLLKVNFATFNQVYLAPELSLLSPGADLIKLFWRKFNDSIL